MVDRLVVGVLLMSCGREGYKLMRRDLALILTATTDWSGLTRTDNSLALLVFQKPGMVLLVFQDPGMALLVFQDPGMVLLVFQDPGMALLVFQNPGMALWIL